MDKGSFGHLNRDIASFPFSPTQKNKVIKAGFRTAGDFQGIGPVELAKELDVDQEEALQILKVVREGEKVKLEGASALELLHKESERNPIVTFNADLDSMLGGGVPLGKMTEFCGVPGIGKTQMGIQLAIDVQIPAIFDGAEGECIYIGKPMEFALLRRKDTEGSFVIERVMEMAEAFTGHLHEMTRSRTEEERGVAEAITVDSILSRIHYYRIHDYVEQIALVNVLPSILHQHPQVRLIVIDSVTFHFRHDFEDMSVRTRLLSNMAQNLTAIASDFELAVVLMNQMTTKITEGDSMLVPALGESWGHCCTTRIILFWKDGQRNAHLLKSPFQKSDSVPYQVTSGGIR